MKSNNKAEAYHTCCVGSKGNRCGQKARWAMPRFPRSDPENTDHPDGRHYRCEEHHEEYGGPGMELLPFPDLPPPLPENTMPLPDITRRSRRSLT